MQQRSMQTHQCLHNPILITFDLFNIPLACYFVPSTKDYRYKRTTFRIQYPRSRILALGRGILNPRSRILDPASKIEDPGIQDPGSRNLGPGSWIQHPGSKVLNPQGRCNIGLQTGAILDRESLETKMHDDSRAPQCGVLGISEKLQTAARMSLVRVEY